MAGSEFRGKSGESIHEEIRRAVKAPIDTNDFSFDYPKLENFLSSNDPVIVVLKGHIYLEYVLVRSISSHLPRPKAVDFDRMNFVGKIGLARAFGVADLFLDACLVINKVRNKIAHKIDYELNRKDVDELVKAMPAVLHQYIAEYASKLVGNQSDGAATST